MNEEQSQEEQADIARRSRTVLLVLVGGLGLATGFSYFSRDCRDRSPQDQCRSGGGSGGAYFRTGSSGSDGDVGKTATSSVRRGGFGSSFFGGGGG
jgi:hypothetical protein